VYLPNWYFLKKKTNPDINQYINIIITIQENIILLKGNNFNTKDVYITPKHKINGKIQNLKPSQKYFKPLKNEVFNIKNKFLR
jgi:hypothetical protein